MNLHFLKYYKYKRLVQFVKFKLLILQAIYSTYKHSIFSEIFFFFSQIIKLEVIYICQSFGHSNKML